MMPDALTTPRPVPGRLLPAVAGSFVVALALPVFLLAGWRLSGWGLGAVLWVASQLFALLLLRARARMGNVAAAGVLAFGMMFRVVAVMVAAIAVAASDASLGLAAAAVYALAYTTELALSLITYFGGESGE
jgi:heme O synthase-like polyprenyltransferase